MQRWIIHIDMDAFYAAVEQRDNPDLRGKPVIIGGLSVRGVVSTASYEARKFGVHSAMPMVEARRRCPQGIFLPGDHAKYSRISHEIQHILADFSPLIEPLSLDEAFLDVSGMERLWGDPVDIARRIKARIKDEIGLTASAGVAANKFLAKLASDLQKPDGLVVIRPGDEARMLRDIPIDCLWGVGEVTAGVMKKLGIHTIGQLAQTDVKVLERHCGNAAYELHQLAHGQDERPVIPGHEPKSIGKEITFAQNLIANDEIYANLLDLAGKVGWRLRRKGYSGRTITVKIRFASFKTITRSRTLTEPTCLDDVIYETAKDICAKVALPEGIRLLGITASNLLKGTGQASLFSTTDKRMALYQAVDELREKYGEDIVTKGTLIKPGDQER